MARIAEQSPQPQTPQIEPHDADARPQSAQTPRQGEGQKKPSSAAPKRPLSPIQENMRIAALLRQDRRGSNDIEALKNENRALRQQLAYVQQQLQEQQNNHLR